MLNKIQIHVSRMNRWCLDVQIMIIGLIENKFEGNVVAFLLDHQNWSNDLN